MAQFTGDDVGNHDEHGAIDPHQPRRGAGNIIGNLDGQIQLTALFKARELEERLALG